MPEVTPAEVITCPSWTNTGSASTRTRGYAAASCAVSRQCVTARRPLSTPVSARTKAPAHTEVTRRERRTSSATRLVSAGSATARRQSLRPGTTTVPGRTGRLRGPPSAPMRTPEEVMTSVPVGETIRTS